MLPMSLARLLVTLLVADAALVGPPVAAPTATFADDQATRGLRTLESAEKTCLYDGLLLPQRVGCSHRLTIARIIVCNACH